MKFQYVGWQVGINYQAPGQGVDWPSLKQVIDRSTDAGMNLISLMMVSYGYYCPEHDGYAWPVSNPRLAPLQDRNCLNADPYTEFVKKALGYAKSKGFHCQLMMNAMIWNPARVAESYPQAASQCDADGRSIVDGWLFCPDSPGGFQLAIDEVTDLLQFYADSPVDSYAFERIGYNANTCFCPHSKDRFKRDTGQDLGASSFNHLLWKGNSVRRHLKKYVEVIQQLRPGIEIWAHTGGDPEWGHFPHVLQDVGITTVSNHGQHFLPSEKTFHQQLDWLKPLQCVPHICVRDMPTQNYRVPLRTPEMIRQYADWLTDYAGDRVAGALFFNEVRTSEQNKAAVYDIVKRWATNTPL
ncbi:MAG: hypothetical protein JXA89_28160 [Anaerolineae bacterium]|nr:hypothetical protein [Anaerolineae bacterium]